MKFRLMRVFALLCLVSVAGLAQITVNDDTIQPGSTYVMTADNEYWLDGFVFVEDGAVLYIQPGTVIKGLAAPSTGENASALIVARGGKIYANGTADRPIIFTAEADNLNNPTDLSYEDRGLWGGVILLGYATTNRGIEGQIEGIPTGEARATYGGDNDHDSSGVLRYVSIRHGGAELSPGDEINGLTLGAVGDGTVIDHVEIYSNLDDGVEWFGGTVNSRYLAAAFCGDDAFDYDEGWRGKNQFVFAIQGTDSGGRIGEHDGGTVQETAEPYATPMFYNATYIGAGVDQFPQGDGHSCIYFRDNAGGTYANSIFTEYNGANGGQGIDVEDLDSGEDSRSRLENGDLNIVNNFWWQFGAGNTLDAIAPQDFVQSHLAANHNVIVDPMLTSLSRIADGGLDPRPVAASPAASGGMATSDPFFKNVPYFGAFAPNAPLWIQGWTALAAEGHLASGVVVFNDGMINAGETYVMTADNEYHLDGFVFVEEGAQLIIEAGTVIKGLAAPSSGDNASALIVARGGKIFANGTQYAPIIFTAEADDLGDPTDLTYEDRGLWGGLILLGRATTNRGIEGQVEGIPTGEARATYGGDNDHDSSGVLRYVSIRHGGAELSPGDEINGLTLGAVGDGTVIDHVEVYSNLDDGVEWFGGTVNSRYLAAVFCGDDGFDYDEGWRGMNQFVFVIQGTDSGGRIGEHDGGTVQETAEPYATPMFFNATYIGAGIDQFPQGDGDSCIYFRDNAGGVYANSIFTEYNGADGGQGIKVEDLDSGEDSRSRLENGDLMIANNIWWQFGNGNTIDAIAPQDFVRSHLLAHNNMIADPQLNYISRMADGMLDPRPSVNGVAATGAMRPMNGYFQNVPFFGAFDPSAELWVQGWTALAAEGHLTSDRWVAHVTSFTGGFQTVVGFYNAGDDTAPMTLQPYDVNGNMMNAASVSIPAHSSMAWDSSTLFGGQEVSHFSVFGPMDCTVTASYKVAQGAGASAEVNETSYFGTGWAFYQGEWSQIFDGLAIVNLGVEPAMITATQRAADGSVYDTAIISEGLLSMRKDLQVFGNLFHDIPGSIIEVHSTQNAVVTFLRGTAPGVNPGYLYVVVPILL